MPALALLALAVTIAYSQTQYPEGLLDVKSSFMREAAQAMGEPFRGLTTSDGLIEGLFEVRETGVSTAPVLEAANAFLATLNPAQLSRLHFGIEDLEWRHWSNVDVGIFSRRGVSLEEMDEEQKAAAWNLLDQSLSAAGAEKTRSIMRTDHRLLELNGDPISFGEEKYYFTFMGMPSESEPWGWQLDGHHLIINYFVLGDQVVMTPAFWGGEPVRTEAGRYAGNVILQGEQDQGLALMQSLSPEQQANATIDPVKNGSDMAAGANQDNLVLGPEGIRATELDSAQQLALLGVIREYVGNLRDPHAEVTMEEIGEHLDDTWFGWRGAPEDDAVFYYRIQSPIILIEFDHQSPVGTLQKNQPGVPTRDHIHTVVRTPNGNDYGKDLLAQHLAAEPHC
ncbi:MAG: DUF3500 domain-containing protein [Gammaproteobacteria bacterium]|nr:DUF3500 domain-containing protein [Gammaproteobacteria bacterium]